MQKPQIKKSNLSVKNPSARGAGLKSPNGENSKSEYRNPKQIPNPKFQITKRLFGLFEFNKLNIVSNFVLRASDFKRWHKISAAFVSIAIIGIVVFFQFAPEKVMRGIFESFAV